MKRLNCQELADALRVHRNYVGSMRRAGFPMPGGMATVEEALAWLKANPYFRKNRGNLSQVAL